MHHPIRLSYFSYPGRARRLRYLVEIIPTVIVFAPAVLFAFGVGINPTPENEAFLAFAGFPIMACVPLILPRSRGASMMWASLEGWGSDWSCRS